jgi:hypothetical protein
MTLVKKGCRRIVVDGVAFRWSVRHRPTYCQANGWSPLTFVVEQARAGARCWWSRCLPPIPAAG